ncbi:HAD domain-containing protein [Capillimicrobium parvum]|uniref:HAD domain-containing protein n=1 Tax=Capillimicrobium parvum TaxID=2884022 RepID=UPI00216AFA97|nr:HAD domain-containing protein [Capillimicrobium parvum]
MLFVDIDGVVSLFGFAPGAVPARCSWHQVDGIIHLLSHDAAEHLLALREEFELVWCSGWEDRANDHLPHVLGLGPYPHLTFADTRAAGHWKLAAVAAHAEDRPVAWIDDDVNDVVHDWARSRSAPTLIVETQPATGLTPELAERLRTWAQALDQA